MSISFDGEGPEGQEPEGELSTKTIITELVQRGLVGIAAGVITSQSGPALKILELTFAPGADIYGIEEITWMTMLRFALFGGTAGFFWKELVWIPVHAGKLAKLIFRSGGTDGSELDPDRESLFRK